MLLKRTLAALLFVLWCTPLWAQTIAVAQISGTIHDSSGGVLPGVEVSVTKTDTGAVRTVFTNSDGRYVIAALPVGPYRLTAILQGFNKYVQEGIVLQVNTNPSIDVTMQVGQVSEQVLVTAAATMVETHSTGVGQVIDQQRVVELPLNGRVATELIFLAGLATSAPPGDLNTNKNYPTVTISVAGGQANGMTYIMDGGTHNDPFNNLNLPMPFPDALQEFKVETSALPARYGQHAASAVNVITKSGTNGYRGNAFEFVRNYRFNARNFFALERDSLKRNQFGGTFGGPVVRDKVFFFGGYQGKIERTNPTTTISYAPTAAMRAGDYTTFASPACNNGRQVNLGAPFFNNTLELSRASTAAMNFLKYVPIPADPCGRLQYGIPNNNDEKQAIGKIDYTLTKNQTLSARYLYANYENLASYDGQNVLTLSRTSQLNKVHSTVLGYTWILSPTLLNSLHVTYNRTLNDRSLPTYFSPTDLGSKIYSPMAGYTGVSVTGNGFSIGFGATNPGYFNSKSWQIADDVDWTKGNHQIALGGNWIRTKIETSNNRPTNGQFTFNGQGTGLPLADFMAGIVSGGFLQGNPVFDYDNNDYISVYAQDNWRVSPTVSLNYGLRWEPFLPIKNTLGYVSNFDLGRFDQGVKSQVFPQAPAGLIFPGDEGFPGKATTFGKIARFAPRIGAIWSPGGSDLTSVRASWGIFYDAPHLFFNTRFSNNPPWGAQITISNPPGGFDDPYRGYPGGNPFPGLSTDWRTAAFPAFGVYVNTPLNVKSTVLQQWNVSVQRQTGAWMFTTSYLGNHSSNLWRATELNPAVYRPGATVANTNTRRVLYLRNPAQGQYYGTIGQLDDTGRGNYNGLLLSAQRRFKKDFSVLGNYTLSKCMSDPTTTELTGPSITDPNNPDLDYSYCASDRRHVLNVSLVYRAPEFKNPTLRALLGDWQLSPIVRWQSGNRSTVTTGVDNALSGMAPAAANFGAGQRAVQTRDNPYGDGTSRFYLDGAAFTSPAPGTYSTLKPYSIVNPSNLQNDLAISRVFRLSDGRSLQARWEIFNVINRVNFNAPVSALNSANFGKILTAGDPRIMQFALKFDF